jgi:BMFP domain-containing protein YqiC
MLTPADRETFAVAREILEAARDSLDALRAQDPLLDALIRAARDDIAHQLTTIGAPQ